MSGAFALQQVNSMETTSNPRMAPRRRRRDITNCVGVDVGPVVEFVVGSAGALERAVSLSK